MTPQDERVHHAEKGRVRADPDREREDGDEGEARTFAQHAHAVAHVPAELLELTQTASVARLFTERPDRAELDQGASTGLDLIETLSPKSRDEPLDVQPHLFV